MLDRFTDLADWTLMTTQESNCCAYLCILLSRPVSHYLSRVALVGGIQRPRHTPVARLQGWDKTYCLQFVEKVSLGMLAE